MSKIATTAIGGLAALTALLLLRGVRRPAQQPEDVMIIHAAPRYDTPTLMRGERTPGMLIVSLN